MTKGAKFEVTVWCFLAMAMITLTRRSDAASAGLKRNDWGNIGSEAGNVDEETSSSSHVTADVKSSTQIFSGYTEQQNVKPDEREEADNKLKTELVVRNSHIKENQSSQKKLPTDSKFGSEFIIYEQNTTGESRQFNESKRIIIIKRDIVIILWNQIPKETVEVKCQSLKDGTVIKDLDLVIIGPNTGYTWKILEVEHSPNLVECVFYWDSHGSRMTYLLYQDTYTAQTYWYVGIAGLYGYRDNQNYGLVQSWQKELQV